MTLPVCLAYELSKYITTGPIMAPHLTSYHVRSQVHKEWVMVMFLETCDCDCDTFLHGVAIAMAFSNGVLHKHARSSSLGKYKWG